MGEDVLRQAFGVVKWSGRVVSLLRANRALGEQLAEQAGVHFAFILVHPSGEQMTEIASLCDAGQFHVHLDATFPLPEVSQAHKLSEGRHVRGKLVLSIA
jgi:NADPH:quinone reductase-like Zn-dependent oxidoreductase